MPSEKKVELVTGLRELADKYPTQILTDYRGMSVSDVTELRRRLRGAGAEYHVVKNTLFLRVHGTHGEALEPHLAGPTAIAFGSDPVAPAKILLDYVRERRRPEPAIKAGLVEGKVYDAAGVEAISKLPGREALLAQILGALNGPASGLVATVQSPIAALVYTLQAMIDQKAFAG
jgi:large subunit ribosomal protein L10